MIVTINGKAAELDEPLTILALLESKEIAPQAVVVERNGDIVPGERFESVSLNDGDHLEILRFVGGG
ncbi:thiamine biosynthesis protein ThiS [Pseudodesulfovibrio mercurii]|uniref:Thiamine biosynthesis protein ThiS n=1 Tax=Pseudodesulfovibrio mercurii TaxID=641491 RepID=F0JHM3_9BACT|nr:sulfur carrier protein ThiS [Pseudodesulfovibrio mercurii]EGB14083.1 thiamine biosynthesis protein ThiS [Pseudodesulfovibrio mercurii]